MSKSPLSGAFAGSSATTKKKNKKNGAILLISGIALATSIGGVFAANSITINSGSSIEFGQGLAETTACDDGIDTSLAQEFVSTSTGFRATVLTIDGLDDQACTNVDLKVTLQGPSGPLSETTIRITQASETVDYTNDSIDAGDVKAITVTTDK